MTISGYSRSNMSLLNHIYVHVLNVNHNNNIMLRNVNILVIKISLTTLLDKKYVFMHKLMFYLENVAFVVLPPTLFNFKRTVLQCTLQVLGANSKI